MTLSANVYLKRLKRVQESLEKWEIQTLLIENPIDIYYLSGMQLSKGQIVIAKDQTTLFVDGRYLFAAKEKSPLPTENSIMLGFTHSLVGFDGEYTSYKEYLKLKEKFPSIQFKHIEPPLQNIRKIKEEEEILLLKKSAKLLYQGFEHMCTHLKEGITEKKLAWIFESFCRENGAEGLSFSPIVAFGANSASPHHMTGNKKLQKGDIVLIDIGVMLNHYASDMTRTLFFAEGSDRLKNVVEVVKNAQKAALEKMKPQANLADLDGIARKVMNQAGLEEQFLHSLGHGIGLEVHEYPTISPRSKGVLEKGMVVTVEPGLYLAGEGGARHEDMIVVTESGCECITGSF